MLKIIQWIFNKIEEIVIVVLSIGILVTVFYGVLVRYLPITGTQMAWTQEVAQLLLVWYAFFGIAAVQRQNTHFNLDFIIKRFPRSLKFIITFAGYILSMLFLIFIAINSFSLIKYMIGDVSSILRFPMLLFPLALFLSCCLMIAYTSHHILVFTVNQFRSASNG